MQYWERIRGLREDADLSQTELAQFFRVGQKTISNWENGRNEPPYEILKKYANWILRREWALPIPRARNARPYGCRERPLCRSENSAQNKLLSKL